MLQFINPEYLWIVILLHFGQIASVDTLDLKIFFKI